MHETSLSLLERLRQSPENEGWNRLADLYTPLIRAWLRRYDVQDSDANDLVQEVLLAVSKDLRKFEHRGQPGAFRGWLKAILINRLRKFWRARNRRPQARGNSDIDARLAQLDDPASDMSQIWDREHDQYVLRQLLALAEPHFEPNHLEGLSVAWHWRGQTRRRRPGSGDFPEMLCCLAKSRVI